MTELRQVDFSARAHGPNQCGGLPFWGAEGAPFSLCGREVCALETEKSDGHHFKGNCNQEETSENFCLLV